MKRIILVLTLFVFLSSSSLAESSAADEFMGNLSRTWGSFLNLAKETGDNVSKWTETSGITAQAENAMNSVAAWAQESGLSDWAETAQQEISSMIEESGIREFTESTAKELQAFMDENGPLVNEWLANAGDEISKAWDMLIHPEGHSKAELEHAYDAVVESLDQMNSADPKTNAGEKK